MVDLRDESSSPYHSRREITSLVSVVQVELKTSQCQVIRKFRPSFGGFVTMS